MHALTLVRQMGAYNSWVNRHIYAVCEQIPDVERKLDQGAFFGSIHRTLNHLLLTDRVWIGRLTGQLFPMRTLGDELYADFSELQRQRVVTDRIWEALLNRYAEPDLDGDLHYVSSRGEPRRYPLSHVLLHIGNHQSHHRGQVTALIQRLGYDYGDIDLLFMPVDMNQDNDN